MKTTTPRQVMISDLKRSGLTGIDAKAMGCEPLTGSLKNKGVRYRIPYYGINGKPTGFYRDRLFDTSGKLPKYLQPEGTKPQLYFSPNCNWKKYAGNPSIPIYIVEGEKKAYTLAKFFKKHGIRAGVIGIGGVDCWSTDKGNLLSDFGLLAWENRRVYIIFDSDIYLNRNVYAARCRLETALFTDLRATPFTIDLPRIVGANKAGIDDFIVHHGRAALKKFKELKPDSRYAVDKIGADNLFTKKLPNQAWTVPSLIPRGCVGLASRPKMGKSYLMLELAAAASVGGKFLGIQMAKIRVLYFDLEGSQQLTQTRLRDFCGKGKPLPPPSNSLDFSYKATTVDDGWLEVLDREIKKTKAKLIIIDTWARVRGQRKKNDQLYLDDYASVVPFKKIADENDCTIILVMHTRKADGVDIFDTVSGSTGVTGALDAMLILVRDRLHGTSELHVTGRNVMEQELAMDFGEGGWWSCLGNANEHRMTQERKSILDALAASPVPLSPTDAADLINKKRAATNRLMLRMAEEGKIVNNGKGRYTLALDTIDEGEKKVRKF